MNILIILLISMGNITVYKEPAQLIRGKDTVSVYLDMEVQDGDTLITGKGGKIEMQYPDSTKVILKENTKIGFTEKKGKIRRLKLLFGGVWAFVKKLRGGEFTISNPVVACGVRGTEFSVEYANGESKTYIFKGIVDVWGIGKKRILARKGELIRAARRKVLREHFDPRKVVHWERWREADVKSLIQGTEIAYNRLKALIQQWKTQHKKSIIPLIIREKIILKFHILRLRRIFERAGSPEIFKSKVKQIELKANVLLQKVDKILGGKNIGMIQDKIENIWLLCIDFRNLFPPIMMRVRNIDNALNGINSNLQRVLSLFNQGKKKDALALYLNTRDKFYNLKQGVKRLPMKRIKDVSQKILSSERLIQSIRGVKTPRERITIEGIKRTIPKARFLMRNVAEMLGRTRLTASRIKKLGEKIGNP